jgi:hypothetical protein
MSRGFVPIAFALIATACSRQPEAVATARFTPQPHATLAQVMRAIPFTFSNVIFDAQSKDPAAPKIAGATSEGATETFKNVYGGWQEVENSALALAEASNLLMVEGRLCENGKPVPIGDATYRQAAEGLAAAGAAAYKAAQSRNLDAMVEVSDTVSVACSNCHEPYRDFDDVKNRCTPREEDPTKTE